MKKQIKSYLAGQVRSFRRKAGLTQEDLGEKIKRTGEAVSNIERGKSLPTLETLVALSETLDAPLRDFFPSGAFDDGASPNRLKLETEATTLLRGLTEAQLRVALQQIQALSELKK